ncbi:MAG TPA: single-stranded DNA-binding protein [Alicycliphilus sp.]|nr:single-stranded DNA-binding protein [Alicycliphilus sp.]
MKTFGLARVGRDVEERVSPGGEPVATITLAFSYGRRGPDGLRATQWVDATLWGRRVQALAPFLKKGRLVLATLEDVHVEEYAGRNGPAFRLVGRVTDLEFAGGGERSNAPEPAVMGQPPAALAPPAQPHHARPQPGPAKPDNWDMEDPPF